MPALLSKSNLLKIGELHAQSGISVKTIRYYEELGLLKAVERTASGYRLFHPQALMRLTFIRRSQRLGLSLHEIGELLAVYDRGQHPCAEVRQKFRTKVTEIEQKIAELQLLKDELLALANEPVPEATDDIICPIVQKN